MQTVPLALPMRYRNGALGLIALGAAATAVGLLRAPERTWPHLLLNGFYLLSLAVAGMLFIATQQLSGAEWSVGIRRIPEALMSLLPLGTLLMLTLFFGRESIYTWSRPGASAGDPAKAAYLSSTAVFLRMGVILALWTAFARLFRRTSLAQDRDPAPVHHQRLTRYAAVFTVVFALSFSLGSFDWLMSLDPRWSSTIFGVYVFAGSFVQGLAAITLVTVLLLGRGHLRGVVDENHLHDLGKLLFAFSTFWAYIWVSQYLLIWYGNLPEEVSHYAVRTNGAWIFLFLLNLVVNWVIPFVVLLPRSAKRNARVLMAVSVVILCGRWLDLYLTIMPSFWEAPAFGPIPAAIALGYLGLLFHGATRALGRAPLVPVNGPYLVESLGHASS